MVIMTSFDLHMMKLLCGLKGISTYIWVVMGLNPLAIREIRPLGQFVRMSGTASTEECWYYRKGIEGGSLKVEFPIVASKDSKN